MNEGLRTALRRSTKYLRVTALGTVVDTVVLWLLAELVFEGYESRYIVAPVFSFECAVISNFLLSYFWVWRGNVGMTVRDMFSRFAAYNVVTFLVFTLKLGLLASIGSLSGWHPVVCNLIALVATGVLNFSIQNEAIFRPRAVARHP
jgi:putative flippase GtrA